VARAALEELRKARIKRQESIHIVVVPKLATPRWMKLLYKTADFVLDVPPLCKFWSKEMHEYLLIGIVLPFCMYEPWCIRGTPKVHQVQREKCKRCSGMIQWPQCLFYTNFAWTLGVFPSCQGVWCGKCYTSDLTPRFYCQFDDQEIHDAVSANSSQSKLWKHKSPDRMQFCEARDGGHLINPFVCHECIFLI